MALNPGDVLYIFTLFAKPKPKSKFAICICNIQKLFFLINSCPRKRTPEANLLVKPEELPCLDHDSYIDTSQFFRYYSSEIENAKESGVLSDHLKSKIKKVAIKNRYLTGNQKKLIKTNFVTQFDKSNNSCHCHIWSVIFASIAGVTLNV